MYLDVTELVEFYSSSLGRVAQQILVQHIQSAWPDVRGQSVLGLGYAVPFLSSYQDQAERIGAFMPAGQGVVTWPSAGPYLSVLVEENHLPMCDASVDRILLVHSLEMSESVSALLREVWRVLAPEGRLLIVVPNRRGVWARLDKTPFGHGRPYSPGQLKKLLRGAMFELIASTPAVFVPPVDIKFFLKSAHAWEKLGKKIWPAFSGMLLVEASKSVYATIPEAKEKVSRRFVPVRAASFSKVGASTSSSKIVQNT
jgi:SAM-dependent methyltransferase